MLIDSHVHLQSKSFAPDLDRVLSRAADAGVEGFVTIGENIAAARKAIALARRCPQVRVAAGIHPGHADEYNAESMAALRGILDEDCIVALGEIGLDFHYPGFDAELQRRSFLEQAHLAAERGLPIVIHCRDAYDELLAMMRADACIPRRGVIHCFSGTPEQAEAFAELGFYIGIGGAITYPNAGDLREAARRVGLARIVSETDGPYLPPQAKRGRRNEPAYMLHAVQTLADACGASFWQAARTTRANAIALFELERIPAAAHGKAAPPLLFINVAQNSLMPRAALDYMRGCGRSHVFELDHEPSAEEIVGLAGDANQWREIILGGKGEPTARWEVSLAAAGQLKAQGARLGLLTGGEAAGETYADIVASMRGVFDSVRIVMPNKNAHLSQTHRQSALEFAARCRDAAPRVIVCIPAGAGEDMVAALSLAENDLGVECVLFEVSSV